MVSPRFTPITKKNLRSLTPENMKNRHSSKDVMFYALKSSFGSKRLFLTEKDADLVFQSLCLLQKAFEDPDQSSQEAKYVLNENGQYTLTPEAISLLLREIHSGSKIDILEAVKHAFLLMHACLKE